ncbi:putative transmembrane sensor domain protein [Rivularia sp. PCC 7116]|uniref:CHASE2 domain-containing protein n=1 Tax=Rivularia sp. PCC 7116 TaxID=373994 RepID=UPI00029ED99D|nr:CHASE2 domain-containing protein [Rivularia sp. PCC 7116]AFY55435.1 putative transmembrane sensor domain protein [Rivularia sp. PCC 7116]
MSKLVILKLGEGDFEQGFPVILQIGDENARPNSEITGKLPPNPEITNDYFRWQSIYRHLRLPSRIKGISKKVHRTPTLEECQQATEDFKIRFNNWLTSDCFRPIREKLLEKLTSEDDIRILIQTKDFRLQKLPWHLWDLLERYPKAEIALSACSYEQVNKTEFTNDKVKILAILGNSEGIDTQTDRNILEQLPNADITFLVEPERKHINNQLWEQNWQILFFAGHSATLENETGRIHINQTESLTISELKYALKKAVARGLQLAIFNSCDGLGLAREFADLHIPEIIVMREPVPDAVAQEFLKYFLEKFAKGEPLYLAVREARERLQGLENKFPCATWLPVICQNPAQVPLSWQDLYTVAKSDTDISASLSASDREETPKKSPEEPAKKPISSWLRLSWIFPISIAMTGLLMGVRYLGMLQPLEIKAFDQLMQMRPTEEPDSRLLVVSVTEDDVRAQQSEKRRGSLSDKFLHKLLEKLESYQPAAIGLDIYRDYPANKDYPELAKRMQNSRFVGVCKVSDSEGKYGVAPPPELHQNNLGFSDILLDNDSIVRRHYLSLDPPPASACNTYYALSVQLALRYLQNKGINLEFPDKQTWQLGKLKFKLLEARTGGYQGINALGHQILLNYRHSPSPENIVRQITLGDVLAGKLNPKAVEGKIVLIGTTAHTFKDYSLTPYTEQGKAKTIPGVILQAQMVSQLLSAALNGRPLLWSLPIWGEAIWVFGWSFTGGLLAWYLRKPIYLVLGVGGGLIILYGSSLILLSSNGCWVPLVPPAIALFCTTVVFKQLTVRSEQ